MKKFTVLVTVLVVASLVFISPKAQAQDLKNEIKIDLTNVEVPSLELVFNLKDQSNVNYLTGFELTFPLQVVGEVTATINNQSVPVSADVVDGKTTIKVATENQLRDLSADTWLNLKFRSLILLKSKYSISYLYLPTITSNFGLKDLTFDVKYPASLGNASFISAQNPNKISDSEFSVVSDTSLFAIWGDSPKLNLKLSTILKNSSTEDNAFLFNLPSNQNQKVVYNDFPDFDGGVYDNYATNYVIKNIDAGSSFSFDLNSDISVGKFDSTSIPSVDKYNWDLKQDTLFAKELITEIEKVEGSKEKIKAINDFIVEALNPYIGEKVDLQLVSGIWDKLNGNSQFNSFEYCYLAISAAEKFGFKGHLAYGYLILPEFLLSEKRSPHIWCEINDGAANYFIDPFLEDQFKLEYNFQQPQDRILFGRWDPTLEYNNILGLTSNSSEELQATFSEVSNVDAANNFDIEIAPQQGDVYSGDYYYVDVNLKNESNYFLQLKDILIDNNSQVSTLSVRNFYPGLIPKKETIFTFNNIVESNILFTGNKSLNLKVNVDNSDFSEESLSATQSVFMKINFMNILKELVVIAVLITLVIVLYKALLEKRIRRFIKPKEQVTQNSI